jgi:hypothetical protein
MLGQLKFHAARSEFNERWELAAVAGPISFAGAASIRASLLGILHQQISHV